MSDLGERLTGQALSELEARVAAVYGEAARELRGTIEAYFEGFAKRDGEMKALIGQTVNGRTWTEQDYAQWRLSQIGRGKRYQALRERIAQRYTRANETAVTYVNDATGGLYALNRNYAAYAIEQVTGDVGFDLWDEQTVRRLLVEQPGLMPCYPPERALRRGIDLAYGRRQITASVTSSILQGKGLKAMADDLQTRMRDMNRDSAIRTARTAVTGAQNAGRMDSYAAAERMGLTLKKRWMATLDGRTRHSHARLDGETVLPGEAFSNGCRFPGDPQGPAHEVYNCRCTLVAELPGIDTSNSLRRTRDGLIPNMTFAQWGASKRADTGKQISLSRTKETNSSEKALQNKRNQAILKAKIESGEISTKIKHQQQAKHVEGTPQFEQYKASRLAKGKTPQSVLTITEQEAQELVNRYAGTGAVEIANTRIVEYCDADREVGKYFRADEYAPTSRFAIHYSTRGAHVVPSSPQKE